MGQTWRWVKINPLYNQIHNFTNILFQEERVLGRRYLDIIEEEGEEQEQVTQQQPAMRYNDGNFFVIFYGIFKFNSKPKNDTLNQSS